MRLIVLHFQSINELAVQLSNMRNDVHSISSEVRSYDERIVSIDRSIEAKVNKSILDTR